MSAFFFKFLCFHQMIGLQKLWKLFLFHLKSCFRSWNIQIFVIFSLPFHTFQIQPNRLVWDIYCAHAYLCHCDSTLFSFQRLKPRRLIFLINCWSNLNMNIVNRAKKMKNEWLTMPTLTKENVIYWFQAFTWLVLCCWSSWSWHTWLKPRKFEKKYLKIWSDFCGTCHGKPFLQLVVTVCWLQFF